MKHKYFSDSFVIGYILGLVSACVLAYTLVHVVGDNSSPENTTQYEQQVKPEYYLEIDSDSVFIENRYGDVYRGQLSDIDSIIVYDNL